MHQFNKDSHCVNTMDSHKSEKSPRCAIPTQHLLAQLCVIAQDLQECMKTTANDIDKLEAKAEKQKEELKALEAQHKRQSRNEE